MKQERIKQIDKELEEYNEVIKKIKLLEKEKAKLKKEIEQERFNALPFEEQFCEWFGTGKIISDLYQLSLVAPKFKEKFVDSNRGNFDRHRTYDISEFYKCENLHAIGDEEMKNELRADFKTEEEFQEFYNELLDIAKELFDNNVAGWVQDW